VKTVLVQILETKGKLISFLYTSRNASQVVGPFVDVPVVEEVLFLKYRPRHYYYHVHRIYAVRTDQRVHRIAPHHIYAGRFCVRKLVQRTLVRLGIWIGDGNLVRFVKEFGCLRYLLLSQNSNEKMRSCKTYRERLSLLN
jgi:hypothetical protein